MAQVPSSVPPEPAAPYPVPPYPVSLHPEATDDPRTIRWVVPAGLLDFVGEPWEVPATLTALLADGTLEAILVGPASVLTTSDQPWRSIGPLVRTALAAALEDPDGWVGPDAGDPDRVLAAAVRQVIAGEVGDYVRSHGGEARLVSVEGPVATIALDGACSACPARGMTLEARFARAVETLCPGAQVQLEDGGRPLLGRGVDRVDRGVDGRHTWRWRP